MSVLSVPGVEVKEEVAEGLLARSIVNAVLETKEFGDEERVKLKVKKVGPFFLVNGMKSYK